MRIVIDMQGVQTESRYRGIGRYSLSFVQAIARNCGDHELILALSGLFPETIMPIRQAFEDLLPPDNIRVWDAPGPLKEFDPENGSRVRVAELVREAFLASLNPDVVHITSLFEGYVDDAVTSIDLLDKETPISVSLYDLIPLLNADEYLDSNPQYSNYYHKKLGYLQHASLFLAISEFTRQEGIENLDVDERAIVNVSTAIEPSFEKLSLDEAEIIKVRRKFGLVSRFLLYAGGADQRKNLSRLVSAFAALPSNLRLDHQLLFAGKIPSDVIQQLITQGEEEGLNPGDLCFTGYVTNEELIALYNMAELFVFPSWHEGFGLPALEAMACGCPVIAANTSSLPEVVGLDEILFDPFDVASIAQKMMAVLSDKGYQEKLSLYGLQRAKNFSWDKTAKKAINAFESAVNKNKAGIPSSLARPKLAIVSPLPPEKTGISEYTAQIIPALSSYYDIDVVVAQERVDSKYIHMHCSIRSVDWFLDNYSKYDRVLYHFGNSPFHEHMIPLLRAAPGAVVLHDFYMSGLRSYSELYGGVPGEWTSSLYCSHGYKAVVERFNSDQESVKLRYPVNLDILSAAEGVIVHSEYSKELARKFYSQTQFEDWEVIPLARDHNKIIRDDLVREKLGFKKDDFIVCSFGHMDPSKLNDILVDAWKQSSLVHRSDCYLVFVGQDHGGGYGQQLAEKIRRDFTAGSVLITGWVSDEEFYSYLSIANMAVQLRSMSRGETSAAVLDCMSAGVPTIINQNGSFAELPSDSVWTLPDKFELEQLVDALDRLWGDRERAKELGERASNFILKYHSPEYCAEKYYFAIEKFHQKSKSNTRNLIGSISNFIDVETEKDFLRNVANSIASSIVPSISSRTIYLDVTATSKHDLKTGIERVARAIALNLIMRPELGYRVEPVYLTDDGSGWRYCFAREFSADLLGIPKEYFPDEPIEPIEPISGDIVLGLDISGDTLIQASDSGLFNNLRMRGVKCYFLVYDLLPIMLPHVFPPGVSDSHARWLTALDNMDGVVCISESVASEYKKWTKNRVNESSSAPVVDWFHLGADVEGSVPSFGFEPDSELVLSKIRQRPTFLMVGTIEPRKGYLQVLDAFDELWRKGVDVNLVIVGREGWRGLPEEYRRTIPQIVDRLETHAENKARLFWLNGISDEYLECVYEAADCLIAASEGEGFGLPLIEAARRDVKVLARGIPVFKEVIGEQAVYFEGLRGSDLAHSIEKWLARHKQGELEESSLISYLTWQQSTEMLLTRLNVNISTSCEETIN